jgi:PAS domain S-box-containing protein
MAGRKDILSFLPRLEPTARGLSTHLVISFILLVLMAAVTVGLPAILLIRDQLDRQAWAQLDQGQRAGIALYAARQNEVESLATLMAQRPTLQELISNEDWETLPDYLDTLLVGAGMDALMVCDAENHVLAIAGETIPEELCMAKNQSGIRTASSGPIPQVWLTASRAVGSEGVHTAQIVVGLALDDEFAAKMRTETGLEHIILVDGRPVATSFEGGTSSLVASSPESGRSGGTGQVLRTDFNVDGTPFYSVRLPISQGGVEAEIALAVGEIVDSQRRLVCTLAGSILGVTVGGSLLGIALARWIGRPLAGLSHAAASISRGDLEAPVTVEARVREVTLVAQALESARVDLQRTLRHLRRQREWTSQLLEAIVEGIVTLDEHGRVSFFSAGAERITGWKRDQVLGHQFDQVLRPVETVQPFSELLPSPGQRRKITVVLAGGQRATLAITGARLAPSEAGDAEAVFVFRDVSEEEAVHLLLGHFIANIAHEFRTPLSALAASIELLMDQAFDLSSAELGELLNSLHLGTLGLQTLVDNLLESASIETGHFRVSPRPADLAQLIGEATGITQPLLDKRGQRLVVKLPTTIPVVSADPRRTVQVIINLLSNANKYSPDQTDISVSATVRERWAQVNIADQGPGIPQDQRETIFDRFAYHDTEVNEAQYGAGLGLSVVKAIVKAQGGEVGVDDNPGGGSIFWFTLPIGAD